MPSTSELRNPMADASPSRRACQEFFFTLCCAAVTGGASRHGGIGHFSTHGTADGALVYVGEIRWR